RRRHTRSTRDWSSDVCSSDLVPSDKDFGIVRHELTHALVHEVVGVNASLPAWFDEGLATLMERDGATTGARGSAVALGILSEGKDRKSTRLNSSHAWSSYAVF